MTAKADSIWKSFAEQLNLASFPSRLSVRLQRVVLITIAFLVALFLFRLPQQDNNIADILLPMDLEPQPDVDEVLFNHELELVQRLKDTTNGVIRLDCPWFGRSGNNMISILSVAIEAFSRRSAFAISNCNHTLYNLLPWKNVTGVVKRAYAAKDGFYLNSMGFWETNTTWMMEIHFPTWSECLLMPLASSLLVDIPMDKAAEGAKDALIIHIRSGDVINKDGLSTSDMYLEPPLSYFLDVIQKNPDRKIILMTDKQAGPRKSILYKLLLDHYPNVTVQMGTLQEDTATILSTENLVISQSSFAFSLAMASRVLKNVYMYRHPRQRWDYLAFPRSNVMLYRYNGSLIEFPRTANDTDFVQSTNTSELSIEIIPPRSCDSEKLLNCFL